MKAAVGTRPLIQLTLSIDGRQTEWSNPGAPVTVAIPYTPTTEELAHPESILTWYLDGSGNPVCVPSGHYDPATGTVTFTATHFSKYAVGYNPVSFNDVASGAWYHGAVSFIAARGITSGTTATTFSPDATLTRGQFITMLLRAYGITSDTSATDNFSDAGNTITPVISRWQKSWAFRAAWAVTSSPQMWRLPGRKCSLCCTTR